MRLDGMENRMPAAVLKITEASDYAGYGPDELKKAARVWERAMQEGRTENSITDPWLRTLERRGTTSPWRFRVVDLDEFIARMVERAAKCA